MAAIDLNGVRFERVQPQRSVIRATDEQLVQHADSIGVDTFGQLSAQWCTVAPASKANNKDTIAQMNAVWPYIALPGFVYRKPRDASMGDEEWLKQFWRKVSNNRTDFTGYAANVEPEHHAFRFIRILFVKPMNETLWLPVAVVVFDSKPFICGWCPGGASKGDRHCNPIQQIIIQDTGEHVDVDDVANVEFISVLGNSQGLLQQVASTTKPKKGPAHKIKCSVIDAANQMLQISAKWAPVRTAVNFVPRLLQQTRYCNKPYTFLEADEIPGEVNLQPLYEAYGYKRVDVSFAEGLRYEGALGPLMIRRMDAPAPAPTRASQAAEARPSRTQSSRPPRKPQRPKKRTKQTSRGSTSTHAAPQGNTITMMTPGPTQIENEDAAAAALADDIMAAVGENWDAELVAHQARIQDGNAVFEQAAIQPDAPKSRFVWEKLGATPCNPFSRAQHYKGPHPSCLSLVTLKRIRRETEHGKEIHGKTRNDMVQSMRRAFHLHDDAQLAYDSTVSEALGVSEDLKERIESELRPSKEQSFVACLANVATELRVDARRHAHMEVFAGRASSFFNQPNIIHNAIMKSQAQFENDVARRRKQAQRRHRAPTTPAKWAKSKLFFVRWRPNYTQVYFYHLAHRHTAFVEYFSTHSGMGPDLDDFEVFRHQINYAIDHTPHSGLHKVGVIDTMKWFWSGNENTDSGGHPEVLALWYILQRMQGVSVTKMKGSIPTPAELETHKAYIWRNYARARAVAPHPAVQPGPTEGDAPVGDTAAETQDDSVRLGEFDEPNAYDIADIMDEDNGMNFLRALAAWRTYQRFPFEGRDPPSETTNIVIHAVDTLPIPTTFPPDFLREEISFSEAKLALGYAKLKCKSSNPVKAIYNELI